MIQEVLTPANRRIVPHVRFTLLHALLLLVVIMVAGCQGSTGPEPLKPTKELSDSIDGPEAFDRREALGRNSEPSVIALGIGDALKERLASDDDELPGNVYIQSTNLNGVPVAAALQAILADTNISLTWQSDSFDDKVVTILNLAGPLPKVVERICSAARIYCSYRNGTLELLEKETFIIEMPPIPGEAENTIADTIGALAGEAGEVKVDTQGGNIIYSADMSGQLRVKQYLAQLRRGRPLIVMQLFIWEVTLTDETETGIKWDTTSLGSFNIGGTNVAPIVTNGLASTDAAGVKGAFSSLAGNVSFGAIFSGTVDAAAVLAFLQHNGHVETVSNPQLTFVSGTSSEFTIGGKRSYISGVGQLVSSSTASGGAGSGTGVGTNTVQTEEIETGLKVKMTGSYEGGVIFGTLNMEDTTLVDLERVASSGTEIQLPITQERKLETVIRLRPGDTMLIAGLRSQSSNSDRTGLPLFGFIPTNMRNNAENHEMVMLLRPSIIRFTDQNPGDYTGSARVRDTVAPYEVQPTDVRGVVPQRKEEPVEPIPSSIPAPQPVPVVPIEDPKAVSTDNLQRVFEDVRRPHRAGGTP